MYNKRPEKREYRSFKDIQESNARIPGYFYIASRIHWEYIASGKDIHQVLYIY